MTGITVWITVIVLNSSFTDSWLFSPIAIARNLELPLANMVFKNTTIANMDPTREYIPKSETPKEARTHLLLNKTNTMLITVLEYDAIVLTIIFIDSYIDPRP